MNKCETHDTHAPQAEAIWAWQPFGPDENPTSCTTLGNHYRGFPVIKICDMCHDDLLNNIGLVFTYKGTGYYIYNNEVKETPF